jgi:pyruvate formate lyase activating enzyme
LRGISPFIRCQSGENLGKDSLEKFDYLFQMICPNHSEERRLASRILGICDRCFRENPTLVDNALDIHRQIRKKQRLIAHIPRNGPIICPDCGNHCEMKEGEIGFCNLRKADNKRVNERYPGKAIVSWYFDPLPTNCVADWVCPISSELEWRSLRHLNNLAVFYGSCNSDCLFCQNASYKDMMANGSPLMTAEELASVADERTACVCYFGGDPACNPQHSLETSRILLENKQVRVCYETNGNISKKWLSPICETVRKSGGTIKFDLKAFTPAIYTALTGVSNDNVFKNFKLLAMEGKSREKEFLVASILLVPGYVSVPEVRTLCEFVADCDPTIPTALLGFHPHYAMLDLPRTSNQHALAAKQAAIESGLTNVRIGNLGLLSNANYPFD